MSTHPKIAIGVLRGGPSSEHDVSLHTGANIIESLSRDHYDVRDIYIDTEGIWHVRGAPRSPDKALQSLDVVWNALHGEFGEDGKVQHILEHFNIPYTGSDVFGSMLAMNKVLAKERVKAVGIKTPLYAVVRADSDMPLLEQLDHVFRALPFPMIVKPVSLGSSVGITVVNDFHSLEAAVRRALSYASPALIEECIRGTEATCGVIDHFRGESVYSLLPIEIRPPEHKEFFDYEAKYSGISTEICPGNFSPRDMRELQELAVAAHNTLGLRHYSRSDFIVTPKRGIYFLETNTLPGFTQESLFPKALRAVGSNTQEFIDHIINLALSRK